MILEPAQARALGEALRSVDESIDEVVLISNGSAVLVCGRAEVDGRGVTPLRFQAEVRPNGAVRLDLFEAA